MHSTLIEGYVKEITCWLNNPEFLFKKLSMDISVGQSRAVFSLLPINGTLEAFQVVF